MSETVLGFTDIVLAFRACEPGSEDYLHYEMMFSDETHAWAEAIVELHVQEYEIDPRLKSHLWEIVKKTNIELLEDLEVEMFGISMFMDFYMKYLNQSMLLGYFQEQPRLAEIIRKNIKHKYFEHFVLPMLEGGKLCNISGRKIINDAYNPPAYDAWTRVKEDGYSTTIQSLKNSIDSTLDGGEEDEAETAAGMPAIEKIDLKIRKALWREVRNEIQRMVDEDWPYERVPYKNPRAETNRYFRTTLNWFLMNFLLTDPEYEPEVSHVIGELEVKERLNSQLYNTGETWLPDLMDSFRKRGPSDFYSEKNVGLKGRNYGTLFDRIANAIYNILLVPELAQLVESEWGIER